MNKIASIILMLLPTIAAAGEREAITAVAAHLASQTDQARSVWRYVWMQPRSGVTPVDVDYSMNAALSRVRSLVLGQPIGGDVLAYRLDQFDPADPGRLAAAWDSLATRDPVFHVVGELQEGKAVPILAPHLQSFVAENVTGGEDKRLDVLATEWSTSVAPIYEARFLLNEILDRSYYLMRGVVAGAEFASVMGDRGFFFGTSKKLSGYRANYVVRSGITGDQRIVAALFGTAGPTPATITYDLFDSVLEPDKQFVRNLSNFNQIASGNEVFVPMTNGMVEFFLFDGEGKLVEVAPSDLAVDTTKPRGHDTDLRPAISCISCHSESDGRSMYRTVADDFDTVPLAADLITASQLDIIYGSDIDSPDGPLARARRDYAVAVSPLSGNDEGAVEAMHQHLTRVVHTYQYDLIDAAQAAIELGLPEGSILADHISLPDNAIVDPEVAQAINGVALPRKSWNNIHTILASSVRQTDE